jgi:hypothetical protein
MAEKVIFSCQCCRSEREANEMEPRLLEYLYLDQKDKKAPRVLKLCPFCDQPELDAYHALRDA